MLVTSARDNPLQGEDLKIMGKQCGVKAELEERGVQGRTGRTGRTGGLRLLRLGKIGCGACECFVIAVAVQLFNESVWRQFAELLPRTEAYGFEDRLRTNVAQQQQNSLRQILPKRCFCCT